MRTELQYNLQKARALATELRLTLEAIDEMGDVQVSDAFGEDTDVLAGQVSDIEYALDNFPSGVIGEGHVKLTIEGFTK